MVLFCQCYLKFTFERIAPRRQRPQLFADFSEALLLVSAAVVAIAATRAFNYPQRLPASQADMLIYCTRYPDLCNGISEVRKNDCMTGLKRPGALSKAIFCGQQRETFNPRLVYLESGIVRKLDFQCWYSHYLFFSFGGLPTWQG